MNESKRTSKVVVHKFSIPASMVEKELAAYLQDLASMGRFPHGVTLKPRDALAWAENSKGTYILDSEGVGGEDHVSEANPIEFALYSSGTVDGKGYVSLTPVTYIKFTDSAVIKALPSEEVLLKDFVRRFGTRLEANYDAWDRELSA